MTLALRDIEYFFSKKKKRSENECINKYFTTFTNVISTYTLIHYYHILTQTRELVVSMHFILKYYNF